MYAYKCDACGELHHPKHFVCRKCGGTDFTETPLEGEATVLTWTKVYNLPEGYMKPYLCFVIARFDNGLTVSGQINSEQPVTGQRVKAVVGVVKEGVGRDFYGFIFEPAQSVA
ncbi:MAG: hypothetical protein LBS62_07755 [Clostridiales bacterium]|nr:hypothetical protein [Clostridiales bacterium]